ncbi:DEAD/DEAH box helicase [Sulfidibacter corallicola]|uniref:DEAD/DEAH box helicase n=1 Tax=Sulfidibacter corallicola TaxID=2818388 RepID=A0A8A4TTK0_SULCO|nr:DEAD/DEAH box helicase [Sulfidibacter corallicola]QTD53296.1 DEAD/DEAH box helicase [Sulfidibacter corallicola]
MPEMHPYSLEPGQLSYVVRDLVKTSFGGAAPSLNTTTIDLVVPSSEDAPLPSPWLKKSLFGKSHQVKDMVMGSWRVNAVHLPPPIALKWLVSVKIPRATQRFAYGESIQFWKEAANLVFYSLIHGTYQPVLEKVDHQIRAHWLLNSKILSNQLENMQKRLPTCCSAEWNSDGARRTKESIIRDFFDTSIDHLVRHVAGPGAMEAFAGGRSQRKRKKQNPLDSLTLPLLKALYSKQNSFSAARDVQTAFVALVSNWLGSSTQGSNRLWQTCFTVLPPEIGNAKIEDLDPRARVWRVVFSLQNIKDPSQHIYAQEIWENLVPTQTGGESLPEKFLRDLGRALPHMPELREVLDEQYPTHVDLSTEEVYAFLADQAPHLQSADFGVVLPNWWKKESKPLTTKISIDSSAFESNGMLGFDSMVNFSWKAAVGGKPISDEAFQKMVKHKMALLPIDGQWVEIRSEDLITAVNFFKDRDTRGEMTLREAVQMGLKSEDLKSVFQDVSFDYEGSLAQLFENEEEKLPAIEQPATLVGQLRPYQVRGLSWLIFNDHLGFGACLADDMGLGKTIQLLSLILKEREEGSVRLNSTPTLLVCPMSVVTNWYREAAKFTPSLRVLIHHGANRHGSETFFKVYNAYDLIITTYHLVNRDSEMFGEIKWHRIALDEAQNIKNPSAQQTQAILKTDSDRRIALTGTPVENKLSELWSIMEFLNPGYLGSLKNFQSRFAVPIERQGDRKKAQLLRRLTQPFILRRLKTDKNIIQDLPEKNEMKVYCSLTDEQAAMYQGYVQQQLNQIENAEGIHRNQLVLTTLMKLKQICNHPSHFLGDGSEVDERSGKLMRLTEMLEEALAEGDKSLIFTQFTQMGEILKSFLGEKFEEEILFMHGGISQQQRQVLVDRFQDPKGPKVFILTVKTGGTGLNLTAATHVFHFDRWWNPAVENQATDRAFRIGQKRNVQVHKLITTGTLEDRIDMMIEKKKELAENIVGSDEAWLTQLSTDALRDILTLSLNEG